MKWLGSEVWSTLEVEYWVEKPWLLVFFRNGKRRGLLLVFLRNRRKVTKGGRGWGVAGEKEEDEGQAAQGFSGKVCG
jgi:hypothetical protein